MRKSGGFRDSKYASKPGGYRDSKYATPGGNSAPKHFGNRPSSAPSPSLPAVAATFVAAAVDAPFRASAGSGDTKAIEIMEEGPALRAAATAL